LITLSGKSPSSTRWILAATSVRTGPGLTNCPNVDAGIEIVDDPETEKASASEVASHAINNLLDIPCLPTDRLNTYRTLKVLVAWATKLYDGDSLILVIVRDVKNTRIARLNGVGGLGLTVVTRAPDGPEHQAANQAAEWPHEKPISTKLSPTAAVAAHDPRLGGQIRVPIRALCDSETPDSSRNACGHWRVEAGTVKC